MTASFWTTLPGIITALGSAAIAIGTFLLSKKKSNHEAYEQLYSQMKEERDEYYQKWQSEVRKNIKLEKEKSRNEQDSSFHRKD
ncbi:hypothetical protein [Lactiplantibacillus paraxiangfangensis]|uniref:hypothetical protein n=1 Tax=Lactiplantibacillus paraxiangfangensis TaxID=3076224 RepID=UPI0030C709CF